MKTNNTTLVFALGMLFHALSACKTGLQNDAPTDSSSSELQNADSANAGQPLGSNDSQGADTVFLYFGGFNSCSYKGGEGFPENVDPIAPSSDQLAVSMMQWVPRFNIAYRKPHRSLITCYPLWTTMPLEIGAALKALSGQDPQTSGVAPAQAVDAEIYYRHNFDGNSSPTLKNTLGGWLSNLESMLAAGQFKKAVIIGHSFGGYTAMLAAKALSAPGSRVKVTSLTTLDPISIATCGVQPITSAIRKRQGAKGCNQAPGTSLPDPNISLEEMKSMASKMTWVNLWQAADIYIHSSPINVPGIENFEVVYGKENMDGVINHILFVYPGNTHNPDWPNKAKEIVDRAVKTL
jgi:hypothetical protein